MINGAQTTNPSFTFPSNYYIVYYKEVDKSSHNHTYLPHTICSVFLHIFMDVYN